MTWGFVAAGVVGGYMSSTAAKDAANTQANAADRATGESAREFDLSRSDLEPFRNTGLAANTRLADLLGIGDASSYANSIDKSKYVTGYDKKLVQATLQNFDKAGYLEANPDVAKSLYGDNPEGHLRDWGIPNNENRMQYVNTPIYDQEALNSAIEQAKQQSPFGMLTKPFSSDDLSNDPVYKASYDSGIKMGKDAILKAAAARGGLGGPADVPGGGVLKDLTQFATDYTATKGNEAFNRYIAQKQSIYGMLTGNQTTGLNATNAGNSAGIALTGQINDANLQGANARAAGIVGGANAWNSALSQGYNLYNSDRILQTLQNRPTSGGGGGTYYIDNSGYDSRYS